MYGWKNPGETLQYGILDDIPEERDPEELLRPHIDKATQPTPNPGPPSGHNREDPPPPD